MVGHDGPEALYQNDGPDPLTGLAIHGKLQ